MRLSFSEFAMDDIVRTLHGATTMPWVWKLPLASVADRSRSSWTVSASARTSSIFHVVSYAIVAFAPDDTMRCVSTSFAFCSASSMRIPYMAPEAPEIPTTMRRVIRRTARRSGWHGGAGVARDARVPRGPAPPNISAQPRRRRLRGGCASARPPDPGTGPAAPQAESQTRCSGRVALGSFLRGPMTHSHVAATVTKEGVDLPIVYDRCDNLTDEKDVIAGRALFAYLTPQHGETAFDGGGRGAGLLLYGGLQGREIVRALAWLSGGQPPIFL